MSDDPMVIRFGPSQLPIKVACKGIKGFIEKKVGKINPFLQLLAGWLRADLMFRVCFEQPISWALATGMVCAGECSATCGHSTRRSTRTFASGEGQTIEESIKNIL